MLEYVIETLIFYWFLWILLIAPIISFFFYYFFIPRFSGYPKNRKWITKLIAIFCLVWGITMLWFLSTQEGGFGFWFGL